MVVVRMVVRVVVMLVAMESMEIEAPTVLAVPGLVGGQLGESGAAHRGGPGGGGGGGAGGRWRWRWTCRCRHPPALAVAEVPQELVEPVEAEAAGERAVLHLLVAQHHGGWVPEAPNVNSLNKNIKQIK